MLLPIIPFYSPRHGQFNHVPKLTGLPLRLTLGSNPWSTVLCHNWELWGFPQPSVLLGVPAQWTPDNWKVAPQGLLGVSSSSLYRTEARLEHDNPIVGGTTEDRHFQWKKTNETLLTTTICWCEFIFLVQRPGQGLDDDASLLICSNPILLLNCLKRQ